MKATRAWLCSAIVLGTLVCVPVSGGAESDDAAQLNEFKSALERDAFFVTPGLPTKFNLADDWCARKPGVSHAWWTNKAPYLFLTLPKSAEEPQTLLSDFQMRGDEAIVLIGTTPPPVKYFGFYTFIARKVFPDGAKREIVNSVADPVNNLTIEHAGKGEGLPPFNTEVVLIFTPDEGTFRRVRDALKSAGYPDAIINKVVLPASLLSFGYGDHADEFRLSLRTAIWPGGQEEEDSYINDAANKLHLFRVTPKDPYSGSEPEPIPMPPLRVRGTGQSELYLWNKLAELRAGIIKANKKELDVVPTELPIVPAIGYEGFDYMQRAEDVFGDARDAFILQGGYLPEFGTRTVITLADDEFLMVFGANHVATGKATYVNINVYTGEEKDGKLSIGAIDDREFAGTATPYLSRDDPAANLMYAYKISRNCGGEPDCLQLAAPDGCSRLKLDSSTVLGVIIRPYLEPATKIGAAMPEVLYDRLIKFSPRRPARQ